MLQLLQYTELLLYLPTLKYPTPAIGGLFYGVSSGSGLGRASNTHSENKNLYLETDEFSSTPPFSKKQLAGAILHLTFGREV
jgi:hypothetical protein